MMIRDKLKTIRRHRGFIVFLCLVVLLLSSVVAEAKSGGICHIERSYSGLTSELAAEVGQLRKLGKIKKIGIWSDHPIELIVPKGRLHKKAPRYKELQKPLQQFVKSGSTSDWDSSLVLESYFEKNPHRTGNDDPRWQKEGEKFLKAAGVKKSAQQALSSWDLVVTDRLPKHYAIHDATGKRTLIVSMVCLDRELKGDWKDKSVWKKGLFSLMKKMLS